MTAAERFVHARPRLLRLAYRELGDVGEAEDVVQEAWVRLQRAGRGARVARAWAAPGRRSVHEPVEIKLNGRLGLVLVSGDGHRAALSFVVGDGRITRIDAIRNPEKLRRV